MAENFSPGGAPTPVPGSYSPPVGPKHNMDPGPGLRGGTNFGNCGSQGEKSIDAEASGRPGLFPGGENLGLTNTPGR